MDFFKEFNRPTVKVSESSIIGTVRKWRSRKWNLEKPQAVNMPVGGGQSNLIDPGRHCNL
jgi:hypothetical protein